MPTTVVSAESVASAFEMLLQDLDLPDRIGVAALLSKRLLRCLPVALQAETAAEYAAVVQRLHDA